MDFFPISSICVLINRGTVLVCAMAINDNNADIDTISLNGKFMNSGKNSPAADIVDKNLLFAISHNLVYCLRINPIRNIQKFQSTMKANLCSQ